MKLMPSLALTTGSDNRAECGNIVKLSSKRTERIYKKMKKENKKLLVHSNIYFSMTTSFGKIYFPFSSL